MKVGDRVAIADLDGYTPYEPQGLYVGNLGTVMEVAEDIVCVKVDGATICPDYAWAFYPESLEIVE